MRSQPATAARLTRLSPEIRVAATLVLLFLIAQLSDQWTFHHLIFRGINERPWGRMLRLAGYLPLWGIVALALVLHDWVPRGLPTLPRASRRGLLLFWSAALAGIIAELLKIAFHRERPGLTNGTHVFRSWSEKPFSTAQLGLPSSEVAVAFAAATILARLFPDAWLRGMYSPSMRAHPSRQRCLLRERRDSGGAGGIRQCADPVAAPRPGWNAGWCLVRRCERVTGAYREMLQDDLDWTGYLRL
jgi:PAP2 superfamily